MMRRPRSSGGRPAHRGALARIVANAAVLGAGKGANALFTLGYLALTTRALGLGTLGLLVLIHTYAQVVGEIVRLRSWESVLRYGAPALHDGRRGDLQSLIRFSSLLDIASSVAGALVAMAGCSVAAAALGWPAGTVWPATLYCLVVLFVAPATPTGLLRLLDRFDLLALHSTVSSFVRLLGAAVLLALGGGLEAFLAVWFGAAVCATGTLVWLAWREARAQGLTWALRGPLSGLTEPLEGIWRFAFTTNLNSMAATLSTHAPTLIVGGLLGAADAGVFRIARELAGALAKPAKLLVPTIFPELTRLAASGDVRGLRALVLHSIRLASVAAAGCFAVLWLFGDLLLRLVVGESGPEAYRVMLLLGAGALLTLAAFPIEPLLLAVGRDTAALGARAAAILLHLVLIVALTPFVGLPAAGVAAIAAALTMIFWQARAARRWFAAAAHESERRHFSVTEATPEATLAPAHRGS